MKKIIIVLGTIIVLLTSYIIVIKGIEKRNTPVVKQIKEVEVTEQAEQTKSPEPKNNNTPTPMASPTATPTATPIKQKLTICIDAGHGITSRHDKEAVNPNGGEKKAANVSGAAGEEEFNLAVAKILEQKLTKDGFTVVMTRNEHNCDLSNIERAEMGNECDMVVRIHADGSENSSISGLSVLIPEKSYYDDKEFVANSKKLGQAVLDATIGETGAKSKGLIVRGDLTGFNWSRVPSVLIECGFLSNGAEKEKLLSADYQEKLAEGMKNGIKNYLAN